MDFYLSYSSHIWIVSQFRLQIKENRQKKFLFWIHHLLIETKALYFRKVDVRLFRRDVVSWESNNWFVFFVVEPVKNNGCLRGTNNDLLFDRFKLPVDSRLSLPFKFNDILFMIPHWDKTKITSLWLEFIRLFLVISNQSYVFAEESVEWDCCETASNDHSVHTELQIAVLFIIFIGSLINFILLVLEWVIQVSLLFWSCVPESDVLD